MNKIFKNEKSFFGKIEALFWKLYQKESFRFLIAGGLNTLLGTVGAILLRLVFDANNWNAKIPFDFLTNIGLVEPNMDIPYLIVFVAFLPIAYTLQAKISFQTKWEWKRLAIYPLSSIPNFICQELFIYIFEVLLHVNPSVSYVLSPICSLPIMFFIIRVLVKPFKKNVHRRMKDIKYIFCDIDGTLIDSNSKLAPETIKCIEENKNRYVFYLISGRNYQGVKTIHDILKLDTPLICGNGSLVATKDKEVLWYQEMDLALAHEIYEEYYKRDLSVSVYDTFNWYVNARNEWTGIEEQITGLTPEIIDDIKNIKNISKIMIIASEEKVDELYPLIKKKYRSLTVVRSKPMFIEIMTKNVDKKNALHFLRKKEKISKKNIVTIGDSTPDLGMFEEAGLAVAMQNAKQNIKDKADYVVKSNNELGVKCLIEEIREAQK